MEEKILLKRKEVEKMLGISCALIYQLMTIGEFPRPIKIANRCVRWRVEDINKWVKDKAAAMPSVG